MEVDGRRLSNARGSANCMRGTFFCTPKKPTSTAEGVEEEIGSNSNQGGKGGNPPPQAKTMAQVRESDGMAIETNKGGKGYIPPPKPMHRR